MFRVVLYRPEIPPNTGNVIRLCANTGCSLHLIGPLGFSLEDRHLRRAGLDYRELAVLRTHADLDAFLAAERPPRLWAFTTRGTAAHTEARFGPGDALLFGPETAGLPAEVLARIPAARRLRLPMRPGNRSLNLSNAVAVAVYEAWRQHGFAGAAPPG
ncbi:tRNA (cytidine(34)-2'-O)-methyltransferase [Inmirania thermothiophila]|uniref:tRNA (cytidine(34)-2'-O)-methyltransferase n=1 Tax=Inmirania thermothiophila TaxID=1750597 RepID=A0A3N1Y9C2_9GAMM|nr:tRNA (cytidine(34)-2'-O)-methyltransferase [Inmirania thermothiophila]ROR34212.1 tRNA (cytidine/uridine-2'-O-)-methyltransferase [Inmirania thermothiophila]